MRGESRHTPKRASPVCAAAVMGFMAAVGFVATVGFMATFSAALPARAAASDPASAPVTLAPSPGSGSVSGTAAAPDEDIRDIRGPKGMLPPWLIPALLAGTVLLILGGYAAWRRHRRRSTPRVLLPFEATLQRLEDIRRLLDPASAREFSIAVSDAVRQYIEVQFSVTATHRTTEEFLHDLLETSNAALAAHRNLLAEFLNQCDLAKFAGVSLSRQILESLHRSARSFVTESSKPPLAADTREAPPALAPPARAEQPARIAPSTRTKEAHDSLPST